MSILSDTERSVLCGEASIIDYICASLEGAEDGEKQAELRYWQRVRDARKNGEKLVLFAGPAPAELIYAAGCVPLYLDLLPLAVSKSAELTRSYIYDVDTHVSSNLCSGSKTILGALRQGGIRADAFVRAAVACPSFKSSYDEVQTRLGLKYFEFDTPSRLSERNIGYLAGTMPRFLDFLQELSGNRPECSDIRKLMEEKNRAKALLDLCAAQRKNIPCPMSSHMVELGRLMPAIGCTGELTQLLERELALCMERAGQGIGPCPDGEKHRVFFLQAPHWCAPELRRWLEQKYGAVTVMDGMGYSAGPLYNGADGMEDCLRELAAGLFEPPALHGGNRGAQELISGTLSLTEEYAPDTLLFLGDRWCRQIWAVTKMLSDSLHERFGLSIFMTDADGIDPGYKDEGQIKTLVSEYMDTVVCGK